MSGRSVRLAAEAAGRRDQEDRNRLFGFDRLRSRLQTGKIMRKMNQIDVPTD
jgi:hypothetical protein